MIELRWRQWEEPLDDAGGWIFNDEGQRVTTETKQALQYRYKRNVEMGATFGFGGVRDLWSEWQDVPVVKEGD